jgi:AbrB family looped-hinge helix DNA binding protein
MSGNTSSGLGTSAPPATAATGRSFRRAAVLPRGKEVIPAATTLTSKGRVTIPKSVRDFLGLKAGSRVEFVLTPERQVFVRPAKRSRSAPGGRFAALRGRATVKMTTEEILALTRGG